MLTDTTQSIPAGNPGGIEPKTGEETGAVTGERDMSLVK
jgi:hypothetical protein